MRYPDVKFIHYDKEGTVVQKVLKHEEVEAYYQQILDAEGEVLWYGSKPYPPEYVD